MKKQKTFFRLLSGSLFLFLAILMIFSTSAFAFAADTTESVTGFTDEDSSFTGTRDDVRGIRRRLEVADDKEDDDECDSGNADQTADTDGGNELLQHNMLLSMFGYEPFSSQENDSAVQVIWNRSLMM